MNEFVNAISVIDEKKDKGAVAEEFKSDAKKSLAKRKLLEMNEYNQ